MFPLGKRDDRQVKGLALWFLTHVSFKEKHVSFREKHVSFSEKHVSFRGNHGSVRETHVSFREKHVSLGGNRASTSVFATCLLGVRTIFGFRNMFARSPKRHDFASTRFQNFASVQKICKNFAPIMRTGTHVEKNKRYRPPDPP